MTRSLDADDTLDLVRSMKESIKDFNERVLKCPPENDGGPDDVADWIHGASTDGHSADETMRRD